MRRLSLGRMAFLGLVGLIAGCDGGDVARVAPGPPPVVEDPGPKGKSARRSAQRSTPNNATQLAPE